MMRVLRVLRALRAINKVQGMKVLINSLLSAMKHLGNVILMFIFTLFVFALIAIQLWPQTFHHRCVVEPTPGVFVVRVEEMAEDKCVR